MEESTKPIPSKRINQEAAAAMIGWFASGYTVRTIRQKLLKDFNVAITDQMLLRLSLDYAPDIEKVRDQLAEETMKAGLASKAERLRRLNVLAEDWEEKATADPKAARVYLAALQAAQKETEDFGFVLLDRNDPWLKLLQELKDRTPQESPPSAPDSESSPTTTNGTSLPTQSD